MIIGQTKLLQTVDTLVNSSFPRFIILRGSRGAGKTYVAKQIAKKLGADFAVAETKVEPLRETIKLAYRVSQPVLYLVPDADKMSTAAKNALLKVTEEPPKKAYFIVTITDLNNILATLKSRGTVLNMDDYSEEELLEYLNNFQTTYSLDKEAVNIITSVCCNFYEIGLILEYGVHEFFDFCMLTAENIASVNLANALKIGAKLKYKDDGEGFDPNLFLRTIIYIFSGMIKESPNPSYARAIKTSSKYLSELGITGVSKSATIDMWVLEMQEVLNEDED